jgi:hypothetical protein
VKKDWYEARHELKEGQVFLDNEENLVMLDRRVPGDGTKWYVADYINGSWSYEDGTLEPGDLVKLVD